MSNIPQLMEDTTQLSHWKGVSKAAFRRLPRYHQILAAFEGFGKKHISSKELSEFLEVNETLVRKDMADLEIRGRQNQGYSVETLRKKIEEILGLREITQAVLVGVGHLGKALALYENFEKYGLKIISLFDNDPQKIGSKIGACEVMPVSDLFKIIEANKIKLLILTVPEYAAQEATDVAVAAGVRAIWNFTPCELKTPGGVNVRNEQIVAGFMALSYYLKSISQNEEQESEIG